MKESLSQQTANLKHKNNRHKRWKGIVSILACMVVFCTVYALILPALTAEGTPHCGKEEHTHTEDCYEKKLICGKEEGEGAHHHTDECYREEPVLVCTTPESDGHQHTDDCYIEEPVLTCTNTDPDHLHNDIDGCYTTERKLTCGKEEGEGAHHHTEECYETKRELICGQEENDGHKHTDDCYKKELVCGKEEHKHILACYSDPNADVEDGNVWQRTVSSVTLTGNWGADLAAIAKTQSGYTESTANYAVAEDGQTIHGYTRYGAWANDPYRDNWSAQFADFCLSYAGVPTSAVPQNSDCSAWNYTIPDGYTPKTGDLLLLDTDSNGSADHAGIVTSVSDSTLTAIVGDADKAVRNNTYNIGSETIKGYVSIPENPALATPTPEPTKEPEATPEAQPTQEPEATPEVTAEPTQEPENKTDDAADDKADENKTQDEDVKEDDVKKDDTANNIEVTPTPEVTETPEATPTVAPVTSHKKPHKAPAKTNGNQIDERIIVNLSAKEANGEGKNGDILHVNVNSVYSNPNIQGNGTIQISLSSLPYGVTLVGFDNENKMMVEYTHGETKKKIPVYLITDADGNPQYVEFTQPEGSTVNFDLTFNSVNGVMDKSQTVTLTPQVVNATNKDHVSGPVELKWTGENRWSNLQKTVDNTKMMVDPKTNHLIGNLNYTISAQENNGDGVRDTGSIWTSRVELNDTLQLPSGISFPNDAHVDQTNKTIVDGSGNILFSFTSLPDTETNSSSIEEIQLSEDKKSVTYKIVVSNVKVDAHSVPTKEMDGINAGATLDISKLILAENYVSRPESEVQRDIIANTVGIKTVAYKGNDSYVDEKRVESVPDISEKIEFTKKHKTQSGKTDQWVEVKPGETIEYTITIKNTGTVSLSAQDKKGENRQVEDTLPPALVMTADQIASLPAGVTYNPETRKIIWTPGEIEGGAEKKITFNVNVADAKTMEDLKIQNGTGITNSASFDGKETETIVKYQAPTVTIEKENYKINDSDIQKDQKVSNGDFITYKITLKNDNDSESTPQTVYDTLQEGLEFQQMVDSNGNEVTVTDGKFLAESNMGAGHNVKLTQNGQKLTWGVGKLQPHETVTMYFKCKVDVDNLKDGVSTIANKASTQAGQSKDSGAIGIDYPVKIDKKVKGSSDSDYNDGGNVYEYGSEHLLDYRITMQNESGDKACKKNNLILKDKLSKGLIPNYNLYTLNDNVTKIFEEGQITQNDLKLASSITCQEYLTGWDYWNTQYYTVIGKEVVKVSRSGNYVNGIFDYLELSWYIGSLTPGQSVTKNYQAYLYRTKQEEEQSSSSSKPEFKNTAKINGNEDTVTVYGKVDKGSLVVRKEIQGSYGADITKLTPEQKQKISFSLKKDGREIKNFTLNNFTDAGTYDINNLEYGTYTIEETSGTIDEGIVPEVTVGKVNQSGESVDGVQKSNSFEFTINETTANQYLSVKFVNKYSSAKKADIRKDVWAISNGNGQGTSSKDIFLKSGENAGDTYIIYNITAVNTGKESFKVSSIIDNLDNSGNLTFCGINAAGYNMLHMYSYKNEDTTNYAPHFKDYIEYSGTLKDIKITATTDLQNNKQILFSVKAPDGSDLVLNQNEAFTFFVMCKVESQAPSDVYLNNTATLQVDGDVEYKPYGTIKTKGTPNDANQNNGDSWDAGYSEEKEYHYISSAVNIKPTDAILPGITKSATGYVNLGKSIDTIQDITDVKMNISPQSVVRWKIELLNDGTKAIDDYTISDSVNAPFHILSQTEALKLGVTDDANRISYNVFTLKILDVNGNQIGEVHDLSGKVWSQIDDSNPQSSISIDITKGDNMSIPAGGKAIFTVYTNNTEFANKIYTNSATFSPKEQFQGSDVKTGQLVTDGNSNPTGVKAEANVYALGDYASFSWKTIEEDTNRSNKAVGYRADNNYIIIDGDSNNRTVIYTNNIENTSKNPFSKFVVVDLMPYSGDTGVFNQDNRDSEFKVNFINDTMSIVITDSSGNAVKALTKGTDYTIKYSQKTSFDTTKVSNGVLDDEWHDTWNDNDKSFAIVFSDNVQLQPQQTIKMQYKGLISDEAQPGQIAWNSFGYKYTAYNAQNEPVDLRAEPPKVGVMIQKKPIIEKQVINSDGQTQPYDPKKVFGFTVYEGESADVQKEVGTFTLCQGGSAKLANIVKADGSAIFEDGKTYTVVETNVNGCEFVNVGNKGDVSSTQNAYTFTYDSKVNKINILFINKESGYELPETGGIGSNRFTAVGLALMAGSLMCGYVMRRKRRERRGN